MSNIVVNGSNSIQCLYCGKTWDLKLPMAIKELVKEMEVIKKEHDKKCKKNVENKRNILEI